jgi:NADPH-dependent curcumin reductase CurA
MFTPCGLGGVMIKKLINAIGLTEVGHPKKGQTIVVSAAAGAVGSVVGQVAKELGLTVIGLAGGPEKTKLVEEKFKFDKCIDYKKAGDKLDQAIKEACPQGLLTARTHARTRAHTHTHHMGK